MHSDQLLVGSSYTVISYHYTIDDITLIWPLNYLLKFNDLTLDRDYCSLFLEDNIHLSFETFIPKEIEIISEAIFKIVIVFEDIC